MKKQNVCIIGGGLTGLITALTLSKLNLNIDVVTGDISQSVKSDRTTAISKENFDYLGKLKIFKDLKNEFWSCLNMKLYSSGQKEKFSEILNLDRDKKEILFMVNNKKLLKKIIKHIEKSKIISLKKNKIVNKIKESGNLKVLDFDTKNSQKYNLIIVCAGSNSLLSKSISKNKFFKNSYNEVSVTTILKHNPLKNIIARQIFLDNEIIALLPISNKKTSIVWTFDKGLIDKFNYKNEFFLKKRLKFLTKEVLKNIKFDSKIERHNLNFVISKNFSSDRTLLFGDALHTVHPLAGQGFNMTLRDLKTLENILKEKIDLGMDIGSPEILEEFSREIQPRNFLYSIGIDLTKKVFSFKNKTFKDFRDKTILNINKNNFIKNYFINIADKGFKF
tara:strand:- start:3995 stop:5167 length:1173 start_codon:yes stop_codon:yes gene_type:complete